MPGNENTCYSSQLHLNGYGKQLLHKKLPLFVFSPPLSLTHHKNRGNALTNESGLSQDHAKHQYDSLLSFKLLTKHFVHSLLPTAACTSHRDNSDWSDREAFFNDATNNADENSLPGIQGQRFVSDRRRRQRGTPTELEINEWLEKETGLDRLKMMYEVGPEGKFLQEDTQFLNTLLHRTVIIGAIVSLISAGQVTGQKVKHLSKSEAMEKGDLFQKTLVRGMMKEAFMKTLQLTVFSAGILHGSQAIAAYRNKSSMWEYCITSALGFGMISMSKGAYKCLVSTAGGAVVGAIGGIIACHVQTNAGMSQEQRHRDRIRLHLQQQRANQPASNESLEE